MVKRYDDTDEGMSEQPDGWWVDYDDYQKLEAEVERLRESLADIREVYTGSEGIPQPETAAEAYVLRLVEQMYEVAVKALIQQKGEQDDNDRGKHD